MKVLFITNISSERIARGSGRFVLDQYHALHGVEREIFMMGPESRFFLGRKLKYVIFIFKFLGFIFSRRDVDIIHVHFYFPTIIPAVIGKLLFARRAKIVVTFHGSDVQLYRVRGAYKALLSCIDFGIFVSPGLRNSLKYSFHPKKTAILSAGILEQYKPGASTKQFDFLMVGTLDENKGVLFFIEVAKEFKNFKFAVVGDGPLRGEMSNVPENLTYLGVLEPPELRKVYLQTRYFVSLSHHEAFGLVMAEAMACGLPVIATRTAGSVAQVEHTQNGFLLSKRKDFTSLLKSIDLDAKYSLMSACAVLSAEKHKLENVVEKLKDVYGSLIQAVPTIDENNGAF